MLLAFIMLPIGGALHSGVICLTSFVVTSDDVVLRLSDHFFLVYPFLQGEALREVHRLKN